jgi:hypothetical protein
MCPRWSRIADEIESLACDRMLAASVEPDPLERTLLVREAGLLQAAAGFARSCPGDGHLVHAACEGVVVHCDHLVMWGISATGENALRALAADPAVQLDHMAPSHVLGAVLGVPLEPALPLIDAA